MIIFDNCVLSAFTRLKLLPQLKVLLKNAIISKDIVDEYSVQWQKQIPSWIKILSPNSNISLEKIPLSLSLADLSLIKLSLEYKIPIASDDKTLREYAVNLGLSITGSIGLLKALFKNQVIKTKKKYIALLEELKKDVYISEDLMKWALEE